jgi:serine/threonine protein kinase
LIGQTLSHFRITAKLGEASMGEVCRAEDTKLEREVAIKVLPEAFTADPERFARFEREAKVLASRLEPRRNTMSIRSAAQATMVSSILLLLAWGGPLWAQEEGSEEEEETYEDMIQEREEYLWRERSHQ